MLPTDTWKILLFQLPCFTNEATYHKKTTTNCGYCLGITGNGSLPFLKKSSISLKCYMDLYCGQKKLKKPFKLLRQLWFLHLYQTNIGKAFQFLCDENEGAARVLIQKLGHRGAYFSVIKFCWSGDARMFMSHSSSHSFHRKVSGFDFGTFYLLICTSCC